jgi:hypothetical protein
LLSRIAAVVVAMELSGVMALEVGGKLVEPFEERGGGLVGELGGQGDERRMFEQHAIGSWVLTGRDRDGRPRGMR